MRLKKFLPWIGILLFLYLLFKINIFKIFIEIKNVNFYFIILALLFVFINIILQTFKWFIMALYQGINIPFSDAVKINLMNNFYAFITPARVGVITRAEFLKKYTNNNIGKGLCNVVLDKVLDLSSIFFIAIIFAFFSRDGIKIPIEIFSIIFLTIILFTFFFLKKERSKRVLALFYRVFIPCKLKKKTKEIFESFYENIPKKRFFIFFFLLNLLNWIFLYFTTYLVGLSLGINLPFFYYLVILPVGTLATLIPITIAGLGTREATLIALFSLFGISSQKAFSMSLLNMFISTIIPSLITIPLIFKEGKTSFQKELSKDSSLKNNF